MRYVQIISPFLTHPQGSIVAQDRLGMSDDKLDEFINAGYGIECEVVEETPVTKRSAIDRAMGTEQFVPPRRRRKGA